MGFPCFVFLLFVTSCQWSLRTTETITAFSSSLPASNLLLWSRSRKLVWLRVRASLDVVLHGGQKSLKMDWGLYLWKKDYKPLFHSSSLPNFHTCNCCFEFSGLVVREIRYYYRTNLYICPRSLVFYASENYCILFWLLFPVPSKVPTIW